mgnify:CR=1 FL=1
MGGVGWSMMHNLNIIQSSNLLWRRQGDLMTRAVGFTDWIVIGPNGKFQRGEPSVNYEGPLSDNLGLGPEDTSANDWIVGYF